jgi:hypothetical protein
LGKKKQKLRIGGKRVPRLNGWRIINHHCCPGWSRKRQYWSTGSKGWPPLLGHRNCEGLFAADMAGRVWYLATFGASGRVRKLHLQPSGLTGGRPGQNTLIAWRETFLSTGYFRTSSLVGQIWKGESLRREGTKSWKEKKRLGALRFQLPT